MDIQNKILNRYKIDITEENILKLYKIDNIDIAPNELEIKIQETHKRWNASINGPNEKNAERDKVRLKKAEQYENILKDKKLRKALYDFYNKKKTKSSGNSTASDSIAVNFSKEYFSLIGTTKKIRKADVDFFFKYYESERKNKKVILEMLNKEMKVKALGKEDKYASNDKVEKEEGERKRENTKSPLIVNLFQEATVLKLGAAIKKYEEAEKSSELCERYPKIREGIFEYLEIKNIDNAKQFAKLMHSKGQEVYSIRQERGTQYVPLVDLFNILESIAKNQDVVDNMPEFKTLLKYPNLTPYMYSFVDMKEKTVKGILNIAKRDYSFRDEADFLLNYYKKVHDNFGISDNKISSLLRKAEKKTKQNKILNKIDEKLGRNKDKKKLSIGAMLIHWLVYWPVFIVYFVFEVTKTIFTQLQRFALPLSIIVFFLTNWLLPKIGMDNLLVLKKIFIKEQWLSYVEEFLNESIVNGFEVFVLSTIVILILLATYLLPGLAVYLFITIYADDFNKKFDWIGIERTFKQLFITLKRKSEDEYLSHRKFYVRNRIPKIITNIVCVVLLIGIIYFVPLGIEAFN